MIPDDKIDIETQIKEKILKLEQEIISLKDLTQPISPDCAIGRVRSFKLIISCSNFRIFSLI